ncbi:uncharacterized protein LOC124945698 [Impatiens glandulifera]|uniref:uncharacterized protein LOC124945698 n=1 Tax=Impatiens glandulifera TaxID=253017 RepID=UPI001FB14095|nr:uncharacterized protein LOC124945698 [Impatiens glandulifera]
MNFSEEEKVKSLGFFGTYKESFKLIGAWKKVFFQITLALILPLTLIYLTYHQISNFLSIRIMGDTINRDDISTGTPVYDRISRRLSSAWMWFWLIKIIYFTFLLVFSLLSTAAVTYTVASVYARRDIAFRKVMSVVPKVWKRLAITFLCTFVTFFLYTTAFVILLVIWFYILSRTSVNIPFFIIICIVFLLGFVYLNVVWQLTSVVSVLENYKGFKAMKKSKELIKGKFWLGFFVLLFPELAMLAIETGFMFVWLSVDVLGVAGQILLGMLCVVLMVFVILYAFVIETVFYFVCKSYHNEDVDRPALANHLGDYEELAGPHGIQMGDNRV